jgi:perosamine synthetase
LKEAGIQTRPVWGLIHKQKPYSGCLSYRIEKAEYYSRRILNLPCSTQLTVEEISKVVKTLQTLLDTDK